MTRRARAGRDATVTPSALAGWLFAELAMILVVVAFGSYPASSAPSPPCPVNEDGSPEGLSLQTVTFVMPVTAGPTRALEVFRTELENHHIGAGQVGLVLLFGLSRDGSTADGVQVSQDLQAIIEPAGLPQLAATSEIRPYLGAKGDARPGEVKVELFLFTGGA